MGDTAGHPRPRLGAAVVRAAVSVGLVLVVPGIIGVVLAGRAGAAAALLSAIFVMVLAAASGWRTALHFVPLLAVATVLGAATAGSAGWVVLLGGLALAAGLASARGLLAPFAIAAMLAAAADGLEASSGTLLVGVVAAAYVIVLMRRLGVPHRVLGSRLPAVQALAVGVVLGLLVTASALIALSWAEPHAYYFPIFVLALAIPSPGMRASENARRRVLGTVVGLLVTLPLALLDPPGWVLLGLIVVVLGAFAVVKEPLWVSAALSTMLIVIVADPRAGGVAAGETRLVAVFAAALLVVVGGGCLAWLGSRRPGWFDLENWYAGSREPDRPAA